MSQTVWNKSGLQWAGEIVCTANGSQPVSYEFFKDGLPVKATARVTTNTRSGVLTITTVRVGDAGKYLCIASNIVGRMTAERIVDVHSAPVIDELQSIIESRGMTATLLCRSYAHPSPTVTFRRLRPSSDTVYRSGQIYEDGRVRVRDVIPGCSELIISHVRVSDVGLYQCQSVNRVGADTKTANIDVGYAAEFLSEESTRIVYGWQHDAHSSQYNLTCAVDARPEPRMYWTHHHSNRHQHRQRQGAEHQELYSNNTFQVFHFNSTVTVLQITIPAVDHDAHDADVDWLFGVYVCNAANFFGNNYLSYELRKAEVPGKLSAVRVITCLTTSVQLDVELPPDEDRPRVTGFVIHNQLQVVHFDIGEEIRLSGLRPSTVYLITVSAVNSVGVGDPLQFVFTTDNLRGPSMVQSVTVKPTDDRSSSDYIVSWRRPHNGGLPIRQYLLRYRQVRRVSAHRSKKSSQWRPLTRWTNVSVLPQTTHDGDDDDNNVSNGTVQSYTVQGLALHSYYELEVRAINDMDCSPPFRPPFVFFTHTDRSSSSSWSSAEGGVVNYRSAMFVSSSSRQRHDVIVTSLCLVALLALTAH